VFARLIAAFVVIALVVPVGAALTDSAWATSMGLDVLSGSTSRDELSTGTEEGRDLDAASAEVRRRIDTKDALIQNLIAGRATLAAVTAQFLALDENRPSYMAVLRNNQPGATDEEKMARNVISYALPSLNERSLIQKAAVLVRLEAELHHLTSGQAPTSNH
jgi:hypothetical protein